MRNAIWLVALLIAAPCASAGPCSLTRIATLDVNFDEAGGAYVPMTISGQKINMLIDTGGIFSMLSEQSVKMLGLTEASVFSPHETMFGGKLVDKYVQARDINLGGLKADRMPMQVVPDSFMAIGIGGILAPNVLRHYDVDFDFASGKFNLFSQEHCEGKVVYWTKDPYASLEVSVDAAGQLKIPIQLDGKEVEARIDTGSSRSMISLELARMLFLTSDNDPKLTRVRVGEHGSWFRYPFRELAFQGVKITDPDIFLIPASESRLPPEAPKFILGMNTLRQLHLYIAYKEKKLYVTSASAR